MSGGPSILRRLIGSGDKIALFTLPFLIVGIVLNLAFPSLFDVAGPPEALRVVSIVVLIPGAAIWIWSVVLILTKAPRDELITSGPYALVKHPIYTSVALLILPWVGFLLDTWLGVVVGVALYVGSRLFSHQEEETLARTFGAAWGGYADAVKIRWL